MLPDQPTVTFTRRGASSSRYRTRIQIGPLHSLQIANSVAIVDATQGQGRDNEALGQSYLIWSISMYGSLS